ncbi:hypothetical protein PCANC_15158 [Puccinia coronata f. sp. avenae]|uniref:Phosphatidate cytidylyltransferase, mitochondrial n=1 Tax=Puccinia coronata f. sp. avenae TaxID=200324 RepID=A0A2N5UJK5_9BASI|nr:hypothetical protein PCANC_15158 [Puccinia coronata f. sp. avenae]
MVARRIVLPGSNGAVLAHFRAPIRFAFAYGSAVFPQKSYSPAHPPPVRDFVFAVSHPGHWHSINLHQNPVHYSLPARLIGSPAIAWLQDHAPGAGLWFNLRATVNQTVIKYGVVSIDTLCNDLLDWNTLYLSGRMHKPIDILRDHPRVRLAQQVNFVSALRTALLLLPETFVERELYRTIAGLSYIGDFRMRWAENPHKVNNIVAGQAELFRSIYHPLIIALSSHVNIQHLSSHSPHHTFTQDVSPRARAELLAKLPIRLRERIRTVYDRRWNLQSAFPSATNLPLSTSDEIDILTKMAADRDFQPTLRDALVDIVARPALFQSLKGIVSAGPVKSVSYAAQKVLKRFTASS